jgi:hypothetical protein
MNGYNCMSTFPKKNCLPLQPRVIQSFHCGENFECVCACSLFYGAPQLLASYDTLMSDE